MEAMTINHLISELRKHKVDKRVQFDFTNCIPTRVGSWRGIYAEPALGWSPSGYTKLVEHYPTVESLLSELDDSLHKIFYGWKGGEYAYRGDEPLHVANDGDYESSDTTIVGVTSDDYTVYLITQFGEAP